MGTSSASPALFSPALLCTLLLPLTPALSPPGGTERTSRVPHTSRGFLGLPLGCVATGGLLTQSSVSCCGEMEALEPACRLLWNNKWEWAWHGNLAEAPAPPTALSLTQALPPLHLQHWMLWVRGRGCCPLGFLEHLLHLFFSVKLRTHNIY